MNLNDRSKGFTLIELLVVIAIIGVLSTVVMVSLGGARGKARDAKRLAEVRQIQAALELYYSDLTGYPAAPTTTGPAGKLGSGTASVLTDDGWEASAAGTDVIYISKVPAAPASDGACTDTETAYVYAYVAGPPVSYTLKTCLGSATSGLTDTDGDTKVEITASSTGLLAQ